MKALYNNTRALAIATLTALTSLGANAQTALDTSYEYDAMGRPTAIRNAATYASENMQWDALGRLMIHANRAGESTSYTYAGSDAPVSVQAPNGAATVFDVDGLGQTRKEISPDRGVTNITYDTAGNPISRVDARGARIDTTFDVLNRPLSSRYTRADGSIEATHSYTWDSAINGIGRLGRIATGSNTLDFEYDSGGRAAARIQTRGAQVLRLRAFHNAADGNLDVLSYPSDSVITYHYDPAGQLIRLEWDGQPIASNIQYAPFGPPLAYQLANGIEHRRTHDSAGRINSYTLAGAVTDISYDTSGNIAKLTRRADGSVLQTFQFDYAGRVTVYEDPAFYETYAYDSNGNRTTSNTYVSGWQTTNYSYLGYSNRLHDIDGATLLHDDAGNRTADAARSYTHNAAGRLTEVRAAGVTTRYDYNGLGERIYKQLDTGLTRHYMYDPAGHLIGEYDGNGRAVAEYAWLGDLPLAMRTYSYAPDNSRTATLYAIEPDHLGTPRILTDMAGQPRWRWHSAPFGDTPPNGNPAGLGAITFNLRFPGQYYDAESGLHYNYFRDYDPGTGRYVQSDPIGLWGGVNTFGYVGGGPLGRSDPLGLWASKFGFYVHQRAGYLAFGHELTSSDLATLADAHTFADGAAFQTADSAYRHAMSGGSYRTKQTACLKANRFVREQYQLAFEAKSRQSHDLSLFYFGIALHTLQDSTSPSHIGFQPWSGEESPMQVFMHAIRELADPASNSALDQMTRSAWAWYKNGAVPDGDLFGCGCE